MVGRIIKRYYWALLVAIVLPVVVAIVFGLTAGVISVFSLLVGVLLGAHYVATEVMDEMLKVTEETGEQPFPFL